MERLGAVACPLCKKSYSENSPPRHIRCSSLHSFCQTCLQQALDTGAATIDCPLHNSKETIEIGNKVIEDFPKNRVLLGIIEEKRKKEEALCQIHRKDLDIFCISCQATICNRCENAMHKNHVTKLWKQITEFVDSKFPKLQQKLKRVDTIRTLSGNAIEDGENFLYQKLEDKFQELYSDLLRKKAVIEQEIFEVFVIEKSQRSKPNLAENNILTWRDETEKLLNMLNKNDISKSTKDQVVADLCLQEEVFHGLEFDEWERESKQNANSMKQGFESLSIEFNDMLIKAIEELPLGEFKPNDLGVSNNQQKKKVECGPYTIKLKEKNNIRKIKGLFSNFQEAINIPVTKDAGVFEIIDYSLDDALAEKIESLAENARDKEKIALSTDIQEVILRCKNLTNKGIESMSKFLSHFDSLKKLIIDFEQCPELTMESLNNFFSDLPYCEELVELKLGLRRTNINDQEFVELMNVLSEFTGLNMLAIDFSRCQNLSNSGLKGGFKCLVALQELETLHLLFKGCNGINDDHLKKIGSQCALLENLRHLTLDFTRCQNFTNAGNHIHLGLLSRLDLMEVDIRQD